MRAPYLESIFAILALSCAPRGEAARPAVQPAPVAITAAELEVPTSSLAPDRVSRRRADVEPIERCVTARGTVMVNVLLPDGKVRRECAEGALTTVSLPETASVGGAGIPPSGFTPQVTVSW